MIRTAIIALAVAGISTAAHAADPITGRWLTKGGEGVVAIERCGQAVCGRLARVNAPPGTPTTDVNNPSQALRTRPLIGTPILTGFTDAGKEWRGTIYDPKSGKSYRSIVRANGDRLSVKGCVAMFCRTQEWRRMR